MAKLSAFTTDRAAVQQGEWITVGSGADTFEILTKGVTSAYRDRLATLQRQAARELNRKLRTGEPAFQPNNLPPTVSDKCEGQAIAEECLLDVRGLDGANGPVTADEFRDMLREPEGHTILVILAIGAANRVGTDRKDQADAALGN